MRADEIKRKRTESLLKELIPEAISTLDDECASQAVIIDVSCGRGKYDADVFLDGSGLDEREKNKIVKSLKEFKAVIEEYCLQSTGWYRCPKFHFKFDENAEKVKRLDEIFEKIKKEHD